MANYTITYSCGHTAEKQLVGKNADRERYIAWAGAKGDCPACQKNNKVKACEAFEAEHALPALKGSEKQIAWGRTLRVQLAGEVLAYMDSVRAQVSASDLEQFEGHVAAVQQEMLGKADARWWIDNREERADRLADTLYKAAASR